jgi:diguanylate cyclase (GGDEF)-like protein
VEQTGRATFPRCAAAQTVAAACEGLADDLQERWALPSIYLLIDGRLRCQAARGYFQVVDGFPPGTGLIGRSVATGEPVLVDDLAAEPDYIAALPGLTAEACAPVRVHGQVVGAVNVESATRLEPDTGAVLAAAAAVLGERIEAVGGLPPVPLAQRLARIAIGLSSLTDPAEIQARTVEGAIQISGMASAALSCLDADGCWSVTSARGPLRQTLASWTHAEHRVVAGWVAAGTSSHFPGGTDAPSHYDFLLRADVRAIAVQPLVVAGEVTGLLITADTQPTRHDASIVAAVELLAGQAAASLGMAAALEELSRRATRDPLTGLRNSAAFAEDLRAAAESGPQQDMDTACLFVDVDHFKEVNDSYGHLAGDRLLTALADELARELRDGDVVYRIGGDEFAVLLHQTNEASATAVAERMVEAARRARTTVSVGTAMLRQGSADDVRLRADRALYGAKSAGRDQATTARDG